MRVAVVENTRISHHGQIGVALHEAAALVDTYRPYLGQPLPQAGAHDALIVFGGEQSALDDASHPYLPALADLMRDAGASGRAVLGVCLGAQILARGHGASNRLGTAHEFGWHQVALTSSGKADPVLSALPAAFSIFEWHNDTFTLPDGAVHLAETAAVPQQAFRVGRASYGIQFHFEASRAVVARWTQEFPGLMEAVRPGWMQDHPALSARHGPDADLAGLALARAFVAQI